MDASNPLAELKDIHSPDSPSMFPLALGWEIIIGIIVLAILVFIIVAFIKKAKQKRFEKMNLLITEIESNNVLTDHEIIEQSSILLKRIALMKFASDNPQFIAGDEWFNYLQSKTPKFDLSTSALSYMNNVYQIQTLENKDKFFNDLRLWVRNVI